MEVDQWVDVPFEDAGFQNDNPELHVHPFDLTNFNVIDGLLDTLDGPVVVRRRNYRNMRVERLRARHEKWNLQLDSLALVYLNWAQSSNIEERSVLTGCPGDVDAPPLVKTSNDLTHFITLSQVIGSHCKRYSSRSFERSLT